MGNLGKKLARAIGETFAWALVGCMAILMLSTFWSYWHYVILPNWKIAAGIIAFFGVWYTLALILHYTLASKPQKPMAVIVDPIYLDYSDDHDE